MRTFLANTVLAVPVYLAIPVCGPAFAFATGGDRFAIHWTAEIERLPAAGPIRAARVTKALNLVN